MTSNSISTTGHFLWKIADRQSRGTTFVNHIQWKEKCQKKRLFKTTTSRTNRASTSMIGSIKRRKASQLNPLKTFLIYSRLTRQQVTYQGYPWTLSSTAHQTISSQSPQKKRQKSEGCSPTETKTFRLLTRSIPLFRQICCTTLRRQSKIQLRWNSP